MKTLYICSFLIAFTFISKAQTFCNNTGNVIIYSNYDGGNLKINVDQNIPNIKIGICTYEAISVEVSGTYSANVTEIRYVGYNANNNNCGLGVTSTTIVAATTTSTSINFAPTATYNNSNGYTSIICNWSCNNTSSQGGCNTPDQIVDYFMTQFGGTFYYHKTQYNCYTSNNIQNVSTGGNCCIQPPITTGLQKNNQTSNKISPNPATNQLNIAFNNPSVEHTITLFDQLGQKINSIKSLQNTEKINVKDLERGMYFILIEEGANSQYQKIILE